MNAEEKQAIRERWELKKNVGQLCNGIKPLTDQFRWTPYKQDEEDVSRLLDALDATEQEVKMVKDNRQQIYDYGIKRISELMEENQRLQKALEFYADKRTYIYNPPKEWSDIWVDKGKTARQAIAGDDKG